MEWKLCPVDVSYTMGWSHDDVLIFTYCLPVRTTNSGSVELYCQVFIVKICTRPLRMEWKLCPVDVSYTMGWSHDDVLIFTYCLPVRTTNSGSVELYCPVFIVKICTRPLRMEWKLCPVDVSYTMGWSHDDVLIFTYCLPVRTTNSGSVELYCQLHNGLSHDDVLIFTYCLPVRTTNSGSVELYCQVFIVKICTRPLRMEWKLCPVDVSYTMGWSHDDVLIFTYCLPVRTTNSGSVELYCQVFIVKICTRPLRMEWKLCPVDVSYTMGWSHDDVLIFTYCLPVRTTNSGSVEMYCQVFIVKICTRPLRMEWKLCPVDVSYTMGWSHDDVLIFTYCLPVRTTNSGSVEMYCQVFIVKICTRPLRMEWKLCPVDVSYTMGWSHDDVLIFTYCLPVRTTNSGSELYCGIHCENMHKASKNGVEVVPS
ncbi:hypothetical protein J6590_064271 [Homalodisca vitripennis]|nr:hypothetical protein J6590_064271 [Homalodisca vitripennis]